MNTLRSPSTLSVASGASTDVPGERSVDESILQLIRGWGWFSYVPDEAHRWLAERARFKRFEEGATICRAGEPATHVYGVLSGIFRIYLNSTRGHQITLEEVVPGGWFPHIVPRDKPVYSAECICQQGAVVCSIPLPIVFEFSKRWPEYYRGLYHEFTDRAEVILGRIELLSLHNLNVRLAVYLLRMSRLRGQPESGGSMWVPGLNNQSEVGARVGGTRQRINGVLKTWAKRGLIEMQKDGMRILDIRALRHEATKSGFDVDQYLAAYHGGWQGHK